MFKKFFFYFLILFSSSLLAQIPKVPSTMEVAGLTLKINKDAQKLIQTSVDALMKSPKYFQIKVERANIYFPLIERVLQEENVPEDFKYLVLQESSLIPDAISTSNAVGYWQFKKESAEDVGMIINNNVDERMHIAISTKGAAQYLKKNNFFFNNWINTLLSYNLGLGGAKLVIDPTEANAQTIEINGITHVYILKFLSHKIAFENALKQTPGAHTLLEYTDCQNKTLPQIANHLGLNEEDLVKYNRWLKNKRVPDDKLYTVIVPATEGNYKKLVAILGEPPVARKQATKSSNVDKTISKFITANDLKAVIAKDGDNINSLASRSGISKWRFLRYNDLSNQDKILPEQIYYLQSKKKRATREYHVADKNDTYWSIAQKYGIKKSKLFKFNRIRKNEKLQVGRVMWIAETRPLAVPVEIKIPIKETPAEVKVITYPDRRVPISVDKTSASNTENPQIFSDDFYEGEPKAPGLGKPLEIKSNEMAHEVKVGETLFSISRLYKVTIDDLKAWNALEESKGIQIGQSLIIKKSASMAANPLEVAKSENYITHTVGSGESFYKIAKQYNVTVKQLQEWNNKKDFSISVGEELKIYRN